MDRDAHGVVGAKVRYGSFEDEPLDTANPLFDGPLDHLFDALNIPGRQLRMRDFVAETEKQFGIKIRETAVQEIVIAIDDGRGRQEVLPEAYDLVSDGIDLLS